MSKEEIVENKDDEVTIDNEALEAAVSDAVDEVTFTEEVTTNDPEKDDPEGDDPEGDDPEGDDPEGDDPEGDDPEKDDPEKDDPEGDDPEKDDPEKDDPEKDDPEKDDPEKDDPEKDDPEKQPDHLNDPIPEGTNERTRQRIQSLIDNVKDLSTAREERDEIMDAISRSGATPDQYAGALSVIKLYNSTNAEDKKKALEVVRQMERDLAFDLGETDGLVNLSDFPDLEAEVEAGTITEKYALELAGQRARNKHMETKRAAQSEQQTEQKRTEEMVTQGKNDLNSLGQELMADPAYAALYPQFTALLNATLRRLHPTEWKDAAREVFVKLKEANPTAGTTKPEPKPKNQPLRPKTGSSGGNKKSEADSALDAMNEALSGV